MTTDFIRSLFIGGVLLGMSFDRPQDPLAASIARGKKVYQSTCLACHQAKGTGVPGMNPPLAGSPWVTGSKDTLINIVLNGLDQEISLKGQSYSNPMPAQTQLTNQQIADVLTFVRNSFGNNADAVSVAEVKLKRQKSAVRP